MIKYKVVEIKKKENIKEFIKMTHNINLWFNEKQVKKLRNLYNDLHKGLFEFYPYVDFVFDAEIYLNQFYEVLEESIKNNPDVYHELTINDYKQVIDSFVFNKHEPTNSEYKILFVIKNALMNTYKNDEKDTIKTQPELWEDLKNNHFHLSNQHKLVEYEQKLKELKQLIYDLLKSQKLEKHLDKIIELKLKQTKPSKRSSVVKYLESINYNFYDSSNQDDKSHHNITNYLGKYWVYYYEIQYMKLIPTISQVFEIDDSIKNQLLYAFVNVNYFCFENLVDEFYKDINEDFLEKLNKFWERYFNYKNKSKTNPNPKPNDLGVLSVSGNNLHFFQTMTRQLMNLTTINPLMKGKTNAKK